MKPLVILADQKIKGRSGGQEIAKGQAVQR